MATNALATAMFDPVQALPAELVGLILSHLRPPEAARAREVSRAWAAAVDASPDVRARTERCRKFCCVRPLVTEYMWSVFLSFAWQRGFGDARSRFGLEGALVRSASDEEAMRSLLRADRASSIARRSRGGEQPLTISAFGVLCDSLAHKFIYGDTPASLRSEFDLFQREWLRELAAIPAGKRDCCRL